MTESGRACELCRETVCIVSVSMPEVRATLYLARPRRISHCKLYRPHKFSACQAVGASEDDALERFPHHLQPVAQ